MSSRDNQRDKELRAAIETLLHDYAVEVLRADGGFPRDATRVAIDAVHRITDSLRPWRESGSHDPLGLGKADIPALQAEITARICAGGRWWITSGSGAVWHRVATPTRAHCGMAINDGDKAWALSASIPPLDQRCTGCAKR